MLVVARERDQAIVLTDPTGHVIARVMVVRVNGRRVRIGVDADKRLVRVRREELPPRPQP